MSKRLELFDKLIAKGTTDPFHYYARALELRSLARRDEALAALRELVLRHPDYVPSYLMAAQLAQELGDLSAAGSLASEGVAAARRTGDQHALGELSALIEGLPV